jgi:hypothetical protein
MAYVVNLNTGTDTPVSGVSSLSLDRAILNFGADWRVKDQTSKDELVLTNLNSPVAYPERGTVICNEITDIYRGKGISPNLVYPDKRGVKLVAKDAGTMTITNSDDSTYSCAVPWSVSLTISTGVHPAITSSNLITMLSRAVSQLFETGSETTTRLEALWRGALEPTDL